MIHKTLPKAKMLADAAQRDVDAGEGTLSERIALAQVFATLAVATELEALRTGREEGDGVGLLG